MLFGYLKRFWERLTRWWRGRAAAPSLRVCLAVDALEARWVPATPVEYIWAPLQNAAWSTTYTSGQTNFKTKDKSGDWVQATSLPTADDDVFLNGSFSNRIITVDQPETVHALWFVQGFTKEMVLKASLTISGSDLKSWLWMKSPGQITGWVDGNGVLHRGSLILAGKSVFNWATGNLTDMVVNVQQTAGMGVLSNPGGLAAPWMENTTINVYGALTWAAQSITVGGVKSAPSSIHIYSKGNFYINAVGATWGGTDPALLNIVNDAGGTVSLTTTGTGKATINGNYVSSGATMLNKGTLSLGGTAEQGGGGTFHLNTGAAVQITKPGGVLGIRGGVLSGNGGIAGDLELGNDPNGDPTYPVISPGLPGAPGTPGSPGRLSVYGQFRMYSGRMEIDVFGPGVDDYDKVDVQGQATLGRADGKGTQDVVGRLAPDHEAIDTGRTFAFFQFPSLVGVFTTVTLPDRATALGRID